MLINRLLLFSDNVLKLKNCMQRISSKMKIHQNLFWEETPCGSVNYQKSNQYQMSPCNGNAL